MADLAPRELANRVALRFRPRALAGYVRWKLRIDPAYEAVAQRLRGRQTPVLDVGCGVGILAHFLRARGIDVPVAGIDFDERKIAAAREAASPLCCVTFASGDARGPMPGGHDVVMLDVLQYFDATDRRRILAGVAAAVPVGGMVIIREGVRDGSGRYWLTWLVDWLAWAFRWLRAERIRFPSREEIVSAFEGFDAEIAPLRGWLPFNNYLFVFVRRR